MDDLKKLEAGLAQREATVPALRPDCAKKIVWQNDVPSVTEWAVIYMHGFSATWHEVWPLPQLLADDLGANLFLTRMTGHGQDGDAMGRAELADWRKDTAEALRIARTIGKRVLVLGCSTGCTLTTLALAEGAEVDGFVQLSPNYGLRHPLAWGLLNSPGVQHWGHLVSGRTRRFKAISEAHEAYWTLRYPTKAVYTMVETVRASLAAPIERIETPTFVALNADDTVISPSAAQRVMQRWGGDVEHMPLQATASCDRNGHVMAGDIFSPAQTLPLARRIADWSSKL